MGYTSFVRTNSDFYVTDPDQTNIVDQARKVGADVAIYFTAPAGRETVNMPIAEGFTQGYSTQTQISSVDSAGIASLNPIGTATTWTPGQTYYRMAPTSVTRTAHYIEFLAR